MLGYHLRVSLSHGTMHLGFLMKVSSSLLEFKNYPFWFIDLCFVHLVCGASEEVIKEILCEQQPVENAAEEVFFDLT